MDVDIFFPVQANGDEDTPMARMVCRGCPVRSECLAYAVAIPTLDGIWGGMTQKERDAIRRRRKRMRM